MKKLVSTLAIAAVLLTTASFTGCKEKKTASASVESGVSKKLAACRKKGKIVFGSSGDEYSYINQKTGKPEGIDTDILAEAMLRLENAGHRIVMHIHDEVVIEAPQDTELDYICAVMDKTPSWAKGLLLRADGYETEFYKKD